MKPRALLMFGVAAFALAAGGVVVAGGLQQAAPQDARPSSDPIGDVLRKGATPPQNTTQSLNQAPAATPTTAPAPVAGPVAPAPVRTQDAAAVKLAEATDDAEATDAVAPAPVVTAAVEKREEPAVPERRQRRRVAVIEAIDKITAERMRFEVEVGGRPVRFNKSLIFSARACEVSSPGEIVEDAIAYMDVSLEPRGALQGGEPRQIFRGWMFASTPALSGLQNPLYDAWVVGCKA